MARAAFAAATSPDREGCLASPSVEGLPQLRQLLGVLGQPPPFGCRVPSAASGNDPCRRPLEQHDAPAAPHQLRNELHGAGAGADDGDPTARDLHRVIPASGVEHRARERVEPGDVGRQGLREPTAGEHQLVGDDDVTAGVQLPCAGRRIPSGRVQGRAQPQRPVQALGPDDVEQVAQDLTAPGEGAGPCRMRMRREAVEVRGDIAGHARIGVVPPCSPRFVGPLDEDEVRSAGSFQGDRHRDAGEAGADDRCGDPHERGSASAWGCRPPWRHPTGRARSGRKSATNASHEHVARHDPSGLREQSRRMIALFSHTSAPTGAIRTGRGYTPRSARRGAEAPRAWAGGAFAVLQQFDTRSKRHPREPG